MRTPLAANSTHGSRRVPMNDLLNGLTGGSVTGHLTHDLCNLDGRIRATSMRTGRQHPPVWRNEVGSSDEQR
jgi:hypothetical protein